MFFIFKTLPINNLNNKKLQLTQRMIQYQILILSSSKKLTIKQHLFLIQLQNKQTMK